MKKLRLIAQAYHSPSSRLTRSLDLHHLAPLHPIIPRHRICKHYSRQLCLLQPTAGFLHISYVPFLSTLYASFGTHYFWMSAALSFGDMIWCLGTRKCRVMLTSRSASLKASRWYSVDISCIVYASSFSLIETQRGERAKALTLAATLDIFSECMMIPFCAAILSIQPINLHKQRSPQSLAHSPGLTMRERRDKRFHRCFADVLLPAKVHIYSVLRLNSMIYRERHGCSTVSCPVTCCTGRGYAINSLDNPTASMSSSELVEWGVDLVICNCITLMFCQIAQVHMLAFVRRTRSRHISWIVRETRHSLASSRSSSCAILSGSRHYSAFKS